MRLSAPIATNSESPEAARTVSGRVLLVDDNAVFARALVRALENRGLEVEWLTHGARVQAALGASEYAAAVIETVLPGSSGLKLLDLARSHAPHLKVIMIAASATLEIAVEAMKRGAADFRLKPV